MNFINRPKRIPAIEAWRNREIHYRAVGDEGVLIKGIVKCATEKAFLLKSPNHDVEEWIPLSQLLDCDRPPKEETEVIFTLSTWLAEKKGWV